MRVTRALLAFAPPFSVFESPGCIYTFMFLSLSLYISADLKMATIRPISFLLHLIRPITFTALSKRLPSSLYNSTNKTTTKGCPCNQDIAVMYFSFFACWILSWRSVDYFIQDGHLWFYSLTTIICSCSSE